MEVKIKNNEGLVDATIEVKDGIMIVSPIKEEKFVKWKPKAWECYCRPKLHMGQMMSHGAKWLDGEVDHVYREKGWCFKTEQECKAFCDRLNEAINSVKP